MSDPRDELIEEFVKLLSDIHGKDWLDAGWDRDVHDRIDAALAAAEQMGYGKKG